MGFGRVDHVVILGEPEHALLMQPVRTGFHWRFLYFELLEVKVLVCVSMNVAQHVWAEDSLQESCPFHPGTQLRLAGLAAGTLTY